MGLFLGLFSLEGEVRKSDFCLKAQDTLKTSVFSV